MVAYIIPWAPPWAPVCLWYAFLVQIFCTSGSTWTSGTASLVLPLMFLLEGISYHSFLLDINGGNLLVIAFVLSAVKTRNCTSPMFLLALAFQVFAGVFAGDNYVVQYIQLIFGLFSLNMLRYIENWSPHGTSAFAKREIQSTLSSNPTSFRIPSAVTRGRRRKR